MVELPFPPGLLRGHVRRGAQKRARSGELRLLVLHEFRDAEIDQLHHRRCVVLSRQKNVLGFQIPVDNPVLMRRGERAKRGLHDAARGREADGALSVQQASEVLSGQILHDEVGLPPLGNAHIEHVDDVGVGDGGSRLSLPIEPGNQLFVPGELCVQKFYRGAASQLDMTPQVDSAHSALVEETDQLIPPIDNLPGMSVPFHHASG